VTSAADGPHPRVAFVAPEAEAAQAALAELRQRYGTTSTQDADIVVPLGGDGFMLETLHRFVSSGRSIFGMHRGSVGFLMNPYRPDGLSNTLPPRNRSSCIRSKWRRLRRMAAVIARSPSMRCRCCARPDRRPSSGLQTGHRLRG
jgi:NAD kinase